MVVDHNLQALLAVAISGAVPRCVGLGSAPVEPPFAKRRAPIDRADTRFAIGRGALFELIASTVR